MIDLTTIRIKIHQYMSEKSLEHTYRVSDTARDLAIHYGQDQTLSAAAGLLHDIAKRFTRDDFDAEGIVLPPSVRAVYDTYPPVFHAFSGPFLAQVKFGITSKPVLSAMKWHTTGRAKMTPLEQILYVADYIEPGRPFALCPLVRDYAYRSLDIATYAVTVISVLDLVQRGKRIHPGTQACRDHYVTKLEKDDFSRLHQEIERILYVNEG